MISSPGQSQEEAICFLKELRAGQRGVVKRTGSRSLGLKNLEFFLRAVGSRVVWSALCSPTGCKVTTDLMSITSISSVLQTFLLMSSQVAWAPRSVAGAVSLIFFPWDLLWEIGGWLC